MIGGLSPCRRSTEDPTGLGADQVVKINVVGRRGAPRIDPAGHRQQTVGIHRQVIRRTQRTPYTICGGLVTLTLGRHGRGSNIGKFEPRRTAGRADRHNRSGSRNGHIDVYLQGHIQGTEDIRTQEAVEVGYDAGSKTVGDSLSKPPTPLGNAAAGKTNRRAGR